jgi:adenine-specific DNA-methyltransferase
MRYFGSKATSMNTIYGIISQKYPTGSICDPFGGIGTVGSFFKSRGYEVWTGDLLIFTHYFQIARVKLNKVPSFKKLKEALGLRRFSELIEHINFLRPKTGWLTKEYSEKGLFLLRVMLGKLTHAE